MTTAQDVARNAAAVRNLAAVLERWGLADHYDRAEWIARQLWNDGWRHIDPIPALVGTSSTEEGREAAKRLFEETRRAKGGLS